MKGCLAGLASFTFFIFVCLLVTLVIWLLLMVAGAHL